MIIEDHEARINITWAGANGDLPDPVRYDSTDEDVRGWVSEAVRGGGVPGIPATADIDLTNHIVERFEANEARPFSLIQVRPKTAFGSLDRLSGV